MHSVHLVLAARSAGLGAVSDCLAVDVAVAAPGNRGARCFRIPERAIFLAGSPAARATRDLDGKHCLQGGNLRVKPPNNSYFVVSSVLLVDYWPAGKVIYLWKTLWKPGNALSR